MTFTILHIDSSPQGAKSVTRQLSAKVVAELQKAHPDSHVITRDLVTHPFPHLTSAMLGAFFTPPERHDAASAEAIKLSDKAIEELIAADIIVIGAPMWNFGIPSVLKAWIDHVIRAGKTFKYGATGPEGLIPAGHKAIVVSARGGVYSGGPAKALDHQESYLQSVLGFIGFKDISFVRAEGLAMGDDVAKKAMDTAQAQLADVLKSAA